VSWYSKVAWSEGLFLRAHHFQQADRYVERLVRMSVAPLRPHPWGAVDLKINRELLATGRFAVSSCRGLLEDGTPFDIPDNEPYPTPLLVPKDTRDCIVYLVLPVRQAGSAEIGLASGDNPHLRFSLSDQEVVDAMDGSTTAAQITVGNMRLRYALATEPLGGFTCLGLARIVEVQANDNVVLDDQYIPPLLQSAASPRLINFISELYGLLHHRGESLAERVSGARGLAETTDFLMLQTINRSEVLLADQAATGLLHPCDLHRMVLGLYGELATYTADNRRPTALPPYRHDNLTMTFTPLIDALRRLLSSVLEQSVVPIPLQEREHGIRVAVLSDRSLLNSATFILSVTADMQPEVIRRTLPAQIKIGAVEHISELIRSALPGVPVQALPVAPRQIPYQTGMVYFQMEAGNDMWKRLAQSSGIAIHLAGNFPNISLKLWALLN
jgi:type VI secretion system protein ImpJ